MSRSSRTCRYVKSIILAVTLWPLELHYCVYPTDEKGEEQTPMEKVRKSRLCHRSYSQYAMTEAPKWVNELPRWTGINITTIRYIVLYCLQDHELSHDCVEGWIPHDQPGDEQPPPALVVRLTAYMVRAYSYDSESFSGAHRLKLYWYCMLIHWLLLVLLLLLYTLVHILLVHTTVDGW